MKNLNKKTIQIIYIISIITIFFIAFFLDLKRDFYDNFIYIQFSEERCFSTTERMNGFVFFIDNETLLSSDTNIKNQEKVFAEKIISNEDGFYFNLNKGFLKKGDKIFCLPLSKLMIEKLKIRRQTISYLPYFVFAILVLIILLRFLDNSIIDNETFLLILIEQIMNYSLILKNIGFNAYFDNCYKSFMFYFYIAFFLLQFFAIKRVKLFIVYFLIIWIGIIIIICNYIMKIRLGGFHFTLDELQIVILTIVTIRHSYKILKK